MSTEGVGGQKKPKSCERPLKIKEEPSALFHYALNLHLQQIPSFPFPLTAGIYFKVHLMLKYTPHFYTHY